MKGQWGKFAATVLIALSMVACKGADNSVTVKVDGHGEVSDGESICTDQCTKKLPLSWLQSQLMQTKSVTYTPTANFGYEFFGWTKYNYGVNTCGENEQCTLTVEALCGDLLDFRGSGIPCDEFRSMNKSITAVFVEQGSIERRIWSNGRACVVETNEEIRCWGHSDLENNVPLVTNPGEFKMHSDVACVRDDYGLHCWGDDYYLGEVQPVLTNPSAFTVSSGYICAIDMGQVVCWGGEIDRVEQHSIFNNPSRITSLRGHVCVIDDDGLHCVRESTGEVQSAPVADESLVHLPNYDCTITEDTFECERFTLSRDEYSNG